jgi:hypothetical protein
MTTTTLPLKHSTNLEPFRLVLLLIPLALACFALSPIARADCREGCDLNRWNTFLGNDTLIGNSGILNTAIGNLALSLNSTGYSNTATGAGSLQDNTIGIRNTATGAAALEFNLTGNNNVATGVGALFGNHSGNDNTANGINALALNDTGNNNTATGSTALVSNSAGSDNTADGANALYNTTGNNNIALGANAGIDLTKGDNNIDIGNPGIAGESGIIRIGSAGAQTATFIAGIRGVPISGGTEVGVNSNGKLGVRASSARYKDAIKPMDKASEAIVRLKPVTFATSMTLTLRASRNSALLPRTWKR